MIGRVAVILLAALAWCAHAPGADGGAERRTDAATIFDMANDAFREGAALRDSNAPKAEARLLEAIEGYRTLIEEHGITNPKLYYNLGNAHMMRGEIGRAIVAYRRAMRLDPEDENLRANLAYARSRVETAFQADEASRVSRALLGWQNAIPIRWRLGAFAAMFALGWIVGMVRLTGRGRRVVPRWVMGAALAMSIPPALSLGVTAWQSSIVQGVVLESATGRKGPDPSYEPSFTRALGAGVEFRLLEARPGWVYLRLPDGRTTWLTRDAVEII